MEKKKEKKGMSSHIMNMFSRKTNNKKVQQPNEETIETNRDSGYVININETVHKTLKSINTTEIETIIDDNFAGMPEYKLLFLAVGFISQTACKVNIYLQLVTLH